MRNFSMPNFKETFFAMEPTRYARTEGLERYFLSSEQGLDASDLVSNFDVNSISLGLKVSIASGRVRLFSLCRRNPRPIRRRRYLCTRSCSRQCRFDGYGQCWRQR